MSTGIGWVRARRPSPTSSRLSSAPLTRGMRRSACSTEARSSYCSFARSFGEVTGTRGSLSGDPVAFASASTAILHGVTRSTSLTSTLETMARSTRPGWSTLPKRQSSGAMAGGTFPCGSQRAAIRRSHHFGDDGQGKATTRVARYGLKPDIVHCTCHLDRYARHTSAPTLRYWPISSSALRFRVPCDLAKLKNTSCPHDDYDHGTSDGRNQKHDGGWGMAVESHKVDGGLLSVFGNEDDQNDENDDGGDDSRPAGADSGRGPVLCHARWLPTFRSGSGHRRLLRGALLAGSKPFSAQIRLMRVFVTIYIGHRLPSEWRTSTSSIYALCQGQIRLAK